MDHLQEVYLGGFFVAPVKCPNFPLPLINHYNQFFPFNFHPGNCRKVLSPLYNKEADVVWNICCIGPKVVIEDSFPTSSSHGSLCHEIELGPDVLRLWYHEIREEKCNSLSYLIEIASLKYIGNLFRKIITKNKIF